MQMDLTAIVVLLAAASIWTLMSALIGAVAALRIRDGKPIVSAPNVGAMLQRLKRHPEPEDESEEQPQRKLPKVGA